MNVSRQPEQPLAEPPLRGASARTRALMVATASAMLQGGRSPSVSEVAEAAAVSRSTAYRYFPTQAAMLRAVVAEALGPILTWPAKEPSAKARLEALYRTAFPRLFAHEATFRAALRQSLEPDLDRQGADPELGRGHRRALLARAIGDADLPKNQTNRLIQALSLTFGVEAMIVLKDIWGLKDQAAEEVALWAAQALLRAALSEGSPVSDASLVLPDSGIALRN